MKLKKLLSEVAGKPLMKVISNPYAKAFAQVNEEEQETYTATNKETGNVAVFKSKASRDAAVKSGSHEMRKGDKQGPVSDPSKKDTPKVNIFNKDKEEPKSQPKINPLLKNASKHDLDDMSKPFTVRVYKDGSDTYIMRQYDFDNVEDAQKYAEKTGGKLSKKAQEKGRFGKTVTYLKDVPSEELPKSDKPKKERPEEAPKRPEDMYDEEHGLEDFREFGNLYSDDMTPEQKDEYDNLTGDLEMANANLIGAQEDGTDQEYEEAASEYNEIESKLYDLIDSIYEPKQDEPKSEPSQPKREGDPQVNKETLSKAKKLGITPEKLGEEEYQKKMSQAAVAALTDANYHTEARELIAKLEGKPEWAEDPRKSAPSIDSPEYADWAKSSVYSSEYYDAEGEVEELGIEAANSARWDGEKAADSIAYTLRQNGFDELADKIQSVIKENKSMKLKDLI